MFPLVMQVTQTGPVERRQNPAQQLTAALEHYSDANLNAVLAEVRGKHPSDVSNTVTHSSSSTELVQNLLRLESMIRIIRNEPAGQRARHTQLCNNTIAAFGGETQAVEALREAQAEAIDQLSRQVTRRADVGTFADPAITLLEQIQDSNSRVYAAISDRITQLYNTLNQAQQTNAPVPFRPARPHLNYEQLSLPPEFMVIPVAAINNGFIVQGGQATQDLLSLSANPASAAQTNVSLGVLVSSVVGAGTYAPDATTLNSARAQLITFLSTPTVQTQLGTQANTLIADLNRGAQTGNYTQFIQDLRQTPQLSSELNSILNSLYAIRIQNQTTRIYEFSTNFTFVLRNTDEEVSRFIQERGGWNAYWFSALTVGLRYGRYMMAGQYDRLVPSGSLTSATVAPGSAGTINGQAEAWTPSLALTVATAVLDNTAYDFTVSGELSFNQRDATTVTVNRPADPTHRNPYVDSFTVSEANLRAPGAIGLGNYTLSMGFWGLTVTRHGEPVRGERLSLWLPEPLTAGGYGDSGFLARTTVGLQMPRIGNGTFSIDTFVTPTFYAFLTSSQNLSNVTDALSNSDLSIMRLGVTASTRFRVTVGEARLSGSPLIRYEIDPRTAATYSLSLGGILQGDFPGRGVGATFTFMNTQSGGPGAQPAGWSVVGALNLAPQNFGGRGSSIQEATPQIVVPDDVINEYHGNRDYIRETHTPEDMANRAHEFGTFLSDRFRNSGLMDNQYFAHAIDLLNNGNLRGGMTALDRVREFNE